MRRSHEHEWWPGLKEWWDEACTHTWRFILIGPGPGPKNVLAEDDTGRKVVFPYRNWKRLKEEQKLAEDGGTYVVVQGVVQQFKKDGAWQPVTRTGDVNGQQVTNFTIKTTAQKLVSVALYPEFAALVPHIAKGMGVFVEGKVRESSSNGVTYYNLIASNIAAVAPIARAERPVENAPAAQVVDAAPATASAAPAAAAASAGGTIF